MATSDAKKQYLKEWRERKKAEDPDYFKRVARDTYWRNRETFLQRRKERTEDEKAYTREYNRQWRAKNPDRVLAIARRGNERNAERMAQWKRRWRQTPEGREANRENERRRYHTEKGKARSLLREAVRRGRVEKPDACSACGEVKGKRRIQGHHEDYRKPYDVTWLCAKCHGKQHRR